MAIVAAADLEDYMGRALTGAEVSAASPLVVSATAELEAWLGRVIEVGTYTDTDVPWYAGAQVLELTATPVRTITSVTVDGDAWATASYSLEHSGVLLGGVGSLDSLPSTVTVVYTAGLGQPAQAVAKSIITARVARLLEKRAADVLGLESISVEGYSDKWFSEGFTVEELERMRLWKRRYVSTSVPLSRGSSFASWP